jgi:hypothetical protein
MSKQPERRRRFVRAFAPAVGLLAAGLLVWQGSYAAFNATTADTTNNWGTATLKLQNNGGGTTYSDSTSAAFGGSNLKPGNSGIQCLTVSAAASTSGGDLAMWASNVTDTTTSHSDLLKQLSVSVVAIATTKDIKTDCTDDDPTTPTTFASLGTPTTVLASTTMNLLPANYAAATKYTITAGQKVAYKLTWTFNSTGSLTNDNPLQGKSASADFTWELQ